MKCTCGQTWNDIINDFKFCPECGKCVINNSVSEINQKINDVVNLYHSKSRQELMTRRNDSDKTLIDSLNELMQNSGVSFKINESIYARARFYAIAWIENGQLYCITIDANEY